MSTPPPSQDGAWDCRAFTLVELLVALGVVGLLTSLLLPAVSRTREQARLVECAANMRQLAQGILAYTSERGHFPPNVQLPSPGQYWCDQARVGSYLAGDGRPLGGIFACPGDPDASRSYAMNAWVSSTLDPWIVKASPATGRLWGKSPPANAILLIESWSGFFNSQTGWVAIASAGYFGSAPGPRFGGGGGLTPFGVGRWGNATSEIDYTRHRAFVPSGGKGSSRPLGWTNIAYADSHVEAKQRPDLCDESGKSTLDARWSPLDEDQNK
jgi:prepilin-type N-terminal cleavage/methylation domain-containing protein/prepilin-type processing-associated H-X9-DG protein